MQAKANTTRRATERPLDKAFIDDLVAANRTLARLGVLDAFGHVSVRDPRNPHRYLISRSIAPESVSSGDILVLDLDSQTVDAKDDGKLLSDMRIDEPLRVAAAYPHQLSGGMRQRALIAAALACEPPFLILDEPTTALDVTVEAQIIALLADLQRQKRVGLLLISHNLAVIARMCNRVGVLYAGALIEEGPTTEVFGDPRHPYLSREIACMAGLAARDRPVLGICLGAQLLAAAAGARVYPNGRREVGWAPVDFIGAGREAALRGIGAREVLFHWHGDTFDLPRGAVHRLPNSDPDR